MNGCVKTQNFRIWIDSFGLIRLSTHPEHVVSLKRCLLLSCWIFHMSNLMPCSHHLHEMHEMQVMWTGHYELASRRNNSIQIQYFSYRILKMASCVLLFWKWPKICLLKASQSHKQLRQFASVLYKHIKAINGSVNCNGQIVEKC